MYEDYTRQSLPSKKYRELLGSALCVFNSNNSFIIENILSLDGTYYSWYDLIDRTSGNLSDPIEKTITKASGNKIAVLFREIVDKRNRIIHSFQFTDEDGEQRLATKEKNNKQYIITEEYLLNFIKDNQELCALLHKFRGC
jgi:hypothetical protein